MSAKKVTAILAIAAAFIAGVLSLFASAFPDGLEWSIERITGATELNRTTALGEAASDILETTALLPDYAFKNNESTFGTSFSGIVGGLIVVAFSTSLSHPYCTNNQSAILLPRQCSQHCSYVFFFCLLLKIECSDHHRIQLITRHPFFV